MLMLARGIDQIGIAETAELEVFVEERDRTVPGLERLSRDGGDGTGAAGVGRAARMMRERGRCGQRACADEKQNAAVHVDLHCEPDGASRGRRRIEAKRSV